jgi:thiamine biosynthesis protein ThiI
LDQRPLPSLAVQKPDASTVALLRLSGEVSTKGKATRRQFVTRLLRNAKEALRSEGFPAEIERHYDRIFIPLPDPAAAGVLTRVFGLQSLSIAVRRPATGLDEVVDAGFELFGDAVRGKRFAVRARFVGDDGRRPFRSRDVEVALGERLLPLAAGVDLGSPEATAHIEVHRGSAYFFREKLAGEGGLPLGTEDRALALVSGGFDSAVAAWQLQRRGVALDHVFCNLGGATHRLGTLRVMQVVANRWSYGHRPRFHSVDFADVSADLQRKAEPRYWQVILKRLMLRAAEAIADENGSRAIVTGDAVGQVSSQTLINIQTISAATSLPILRPLVGMNKDEIIGWADHIGTAPLSAVVDEYCALVPRRPATAARLDVVEREEARLDPELLVQALKEREVLDLRGIDPDATGLPQIETAEIPNGAVLVDLRSRREYDAWHAPEALHFDFPKALEAWPHFAKDRRYVLYCEYGLKSAHLAEMMQAAGFRAWHFTGGTPALRRAVDAHEA